MSKTTFKSALLVLGALSASLFLNLAHSQAPAPGSSIDQIIQSLEKSGALDRAIDRGIERYRQRQINAAKAKQEKEDIQKAELAKNARAVDAKNDFIYGKADAVISIIEYSDFECPFCKQFADIPIKVVDSMPNQVNLVWRNFPLPFHDPMASKEAAAAVCAAQQGGNDAFWKYADGIFKNTRSNGQGLPSSNGVDPLLSLAKEQGMNVEKFSACIQSDASKSHVKADLNDGVNAGISGTPGVILINHKTGSFNVLAGAVPEEVLQQEVKNLLNTKK
jgi:protein-disulfide isomerase